MQRSMQHLRNVPQAVARLQQGVELPHLSDQQRITAHPREVAPEGQAHNVHHVHAVVLSRPPPTQPIAHLQQLP